MMELSVFEYLVRRLINIIENAIYSLIYHYAAWCVAQQEINAKYEVLYFKNIQPKG